MRPTHKPAPALCLPVTPCLTWAGGFAQKVLGSGISYGREAIAAFFAEQVHPFGPGVGVDPTSNQLVDPEEVEDESGADEHGK